MEKKTSILFAVMLIFGIVAGYGVWYGTSSRVGIPIDKLALEGRITTLQGITVDQQQWMNKNPCTIHVTIDNIYPGWSGSCIWALKNVGTINGMLSAKFSAIINKPIDAPGELGDYLECTYYYASGIAERRTDLGPLNQIKGLLHTPDSVGAGVEYLVGIEFTLPSDAGNIVQNQSVELDIVFTLDQA
jgi:hypothetical protein